ncbi:dihydrofolate reductase family protein [Algoriphagus sp.]|uniref:dihydrofolate reductase family protein n=1 Tax=Algoriphagus sp. TaxID=1872435 RepID=UPI0035230566
MEKEGEDYGYSDFIQTVDTVIMGRRTYDWVMNQVSEFPHADKDAYIITRIEKPPEGKTKFFTGPLKSLVLQLKSESGNNIFCDGGGQIVNELLKNKLVDELIISIIPILLGNGIPLFQNGRPEQLLPLASCGNYDSGLVKVHYRLVKEI